jgi:hypothetical protein
LLAPRRAAARCIKGRDLEVVMGTLALAMAIGVAFGVGAARAEAFLLKPSFARQAAAARRRRSAWIGDEARSMARIGQRAE